LLSRHLSLEFALAGRKLTKDSCFEQITGRSTSDHKRWHDKYILFFNQILQLAAGCAAAIWLALFCFGKSAFASAKKVFRLGGF
jgi:hypothetical protein